MKQVGYYHLFPFSKVEKNSSVIIYGIGEVGKSYIKQINTTKYCDIEYVTDTNWKNINIKNVDFLPNKKVTESNNSIVIANGNKDSVYEIKKYLLSIGVKEARIIWDDIIIDKELVAEDVVLDKTKNDYAKRKCYYHLFPFNDIEKNEDIIIWGFGEVGQHYYDQLLKTNYANVEYIVDIDWERKNNDKVCSPDKIAEEKNLNKKIVIANGNQETVNTIVAQLKRMNVSESNIIWNDIIIPDVLVVNEIVTTAGFSPYIYGSESELSYRISSYDFAINLLKYDIISFDIFDTLIFRPFTNPTDLFMIIAAKLNYLEFKEIRMIAENKARERAMFLRKSPEVNLEDIYKYMEEETGLNAEEGAKLEFDTELELCFANTYMLEVFNILKLNNKKIIFTSDMYLPRNYIYKLLSKCGYNGIDEESIFVSCEYSISKSIDGALYSLEKNIFGKYLKYVHVGDNYQSDIINAKKNGFDAIYYKNVNEIGNKYRATYDGMSDLIGSAYGGIINTYLHNGTRKCSVPYEFGFIYGGIAIMGYVNWIIDYVKKNKVDKILFLARDGEICQKVMSLVSDKVNCEYALWSRVVSHRLEACRNKKVFLDRFLRARVPYERKMSIKEWLDMMNLTAFEDKLRIYHICKEQDFDKNVVGILEQFIKDNWNDILINYSKEDDIAKKYYKSLINESKHVAVVDIGWAGSGPVSLKYLIEEKWKLGVKVDCLLVGCTALYPYNNTPLIQNGCINVYMFSVSYNRCLYDMHRKDGFMANIMFELLCQSKSPSFTGFDMENGNLKLLYGFYEIENEQFVEEIQEGILDFAREYMKRFCKIDFMNKISGYDAYIPIRSLIPHAIYFKNNFYEYQFCGGVGTSNKCTNIETIGEILEERGL